MKERPILFSAAMVRAILDGRKTQTRRVVLFTQFDRSDTPGYDWHFRGTRRGSPRRATWQDLRHSELMELCPYGVPGDRIWVRETAWYDDCFGGRAFFENGDVIQKGEGIISKAPHPCSREMFEACGLQKCRPSIHMPRWASRITLEITAVRVERLQDIRSEDIRAEGVEDSSVWDDARKCSYQHLHRRFFMLWDSIAKRPGYAWADNPWVWAIEFRRVLTQTKGE